MKLGDQFIANIIPKVENAVDKGSESLANSLNDHIDILADNGRKYNAKKYKNTYSVRGKYERTHKFRRERLGYQTDYVDLKFIGKSLLNRQVQRNALGEHTIEFIDQPVRRGLGSAQLYYYHNWGFYPNPRRQLFPDTAGAMKGGSKFKVTEAELKAPNVLDSGDVIPQNYVTKARQIVTSKLKGK